MIWLFVFLVGGLDLAAAVYVFLEGRQMRLRLPTPAPCEEPVPPQPSRNEHPAPAAQRVVGLSAEVREDGVHLEYYLPPNRRGITSPITSLVSTRQHDRAGIIYQMTTASGSSYLVSMPDDTARRVLGTFYAWRKRSDTRRASPTVRLSNTAPEGPVSFPSADGAAMCPRAGSGGFRNWMRGRRAWLWMVWKSVR